MISRIADIGVIGLGTMGSMLSLNFAEKGSDVALYNRTPGKAEKLRLDNPDLAARLHPQGSLDGFVAALRAPRVIVLMVNAGQAVDDQLEALSPLLDKGDIVIDAGNTDFNDTVVRSGRWDEAGIHFVGMGVSGGELGARHGPSIMVGGDQKVWSRLKPLLEPISAKYDNSPCVAWLGPDGAGHFVKTIHNGIEYADMQMIAEIYSIMRDGLGLSAPAMSEIFEDWNSRGLSSYLIEISATVLAELDPQSGKPLVDRIVDEAGQKGTGRWSVIEAQKLGIGATTLEAAVSARSISSLRQERIASGELYAGIHLGKPDFTKDAEGIVELEAALETARIIAYAQGYAIMAAASKEYGWDLPLGEIARIWRAGCIIRSIFLQDITRAYETGASVANLLQEPSFARRVGIGHQALRNVVAKAVKAGIPVPALSAALAYFDDYRRPRGSANLIQGQRDLFGAHTFRRMDAAGMHHHQWPAV
ncbi:MAG: NADP-dependent phosphogluconate dehydrogenase [Phyllobacterium sp.]